MDKTSITIHTQSPNGLPHHREQKITQTTFKARKSTHGPQNTAQQLT